MPALRPGYRSEALSGAPSDGALRDFIGYNMKRAFHEVQADVQATLAPFGLRMVTFSALITIARNQGLRQTELAALLNIERPNLVSILDELEAAGLILRDRDPEDRRAHALHLTEPGEYICAGARAAVAEHDERMTSGLNEQERTILLAALRRIEANGNGGSDA